MADKKKPVSWDDWGKKKKDSDTYQGGKMDDRDDENDPYKKAQDGASGKKQLEKLKKFFGAN